MDSDTHAQRIKYMQTREYIRTCIRTIQHPHHIHKYIISLKYDRTKILPIRKYRRYDQEYCHTGKHKLRHFIKSRYVRKEKIHKCSRDKRKPHQIRNNKIFNKRNPHIKLRLDHMIVCRYMLFQKQKPRHVDKNIQKYPRMFILFQPASEFTTFFFAHYTTAPFHMQSFNLCDCNDYSTI